MVLLSQRRRKRPSEKNSERFQYTRQSPESEFCVQPPAEPKVSIFFTIRSVPETGIESMNLVLERELPPLREDDTGAIRVGSSRVLLETVLRAFQDGASPESIVHRYSTLSLSDVYNTIGYYLRHQDAVEAYLRQREQLASSVQQRLSSIQPDLSFIRSRLLSQPNP